MRFFEKLGLGGKNGKERKPNKKKTLLLLTAALAVLGACRAEITSGSSGQATEGELNSSLEQLRTDRQGVDARLTALISEVKAIAVDRDNLTPAQRRRIIELEDEITALRAQISEEEGGPSSPNGSREGGEAQEPISIEIDLQVIGQGSLNWDSKGVQNGSDIKIFAVINGQDTEIGSGTVSSGKLVVSNVSVPGNASGVAFRLQGSPAGSDDLAYFDRGAYAGDRNIRHSSSEAQTSNLTAAQVFAEIPPLAQNTDSQAAPLTINGVTAPSGTEAMLIVYGDEDDTIGEDPDRPEAASVLGRAGIITLSGLDNSGTGIGRDFGVFKFTTSGTGSINVPRIRSRYTGSGTRQYVVVWFDTGTNQWKKSNVTSVE